MAYYQPQYAPLPVRPRTRTSAMAVTGLVFSLLWGMGFLSFIGLALSIGGIIDTRGGQKYGRGIAVAGAVIGALGVILSVAVWISTW